ncbi:uncharacterized protein BCR38DRAFT_6125 [Pseudomassariella vexata]|uniref:Homeobox domain-containing protein n=1 Tax=Pseudomassariella vexata TaxID=1141098 RepID=A0A1Y2EIU2_9PEZI|nr:uncharacterized protein BCR38DRAFT_6125 [Pseudomassariella vexata]ORY71234.1 hypothetical protein BCR38DRAFT_6125 [Pseudomassariella vexata]
MLVSRQFDSENHWSSKYETVFHKPTSPRMSNFEGPLSTQPEWQGHYSFLPPGENNLFAQPFDQVSGSSNNNSNSNSNDASAQRRPTSAPNNALENPNQPGGQSPMVQNRALDPLGLRAPKAESPTREQTAARRGSYGVKAESTHEDSLASTVTPPMSLASNPLSSVSSAGQTDMTASQSGNEETMVEKDEDDDVLDDDEMLEGDGESTQPQTAAERTAARRKMKRFRLTHQQTRFLMSEFAKQPHPDAAHRERLSREIPGLSPRQVQVWFQNRRAKIKRLTADDRDRMIKMRAVPDDFDNVQALHSPYGAVHALGTPISSAVDFGNASYAEHMMRPMMVDPMRREGEDHMSPSALSPAFGSIGFAAPGSMGTPDILSPMSPPGNERGYYSSHVNNPLGSGPRTSNPFARQGGSMDTGMQMHSHSRQQPMRPLQPLQLRETMSRSRSDQLQSPLRSSMSWKGDAINYNYQAGSGSPGVGGRQQSLYQPEMTSTPTSMSYEPGSYSTTGVQSPQSHMSYSTLQQPPRNNNSRLRAASATLPLGLDLRTQFRSVSSGHNLQPPAHSSIPRAASTAPYSSAYTSSYPSAPLTAPVEFSLPRTPGVRHDYSMPQMSAPIAPSQDFSQALHGNMGQSIRTPMRDAFGGGPLTTQSQGSGERSEDYFHQDGSALERKRSFSVSQGGPSPPGPSPYHST